jgi:hypothetical protein
LNPLIQLTRSKLLKIQSNIKIRLKINTFNDPPMAGWESANDRHRYSHIKSQEFFKTFPDNRVDNNPYRVFLYNSDDWTCFIAKFTDTMKGRMKLPHGEEISTTNKSFELDFCKVAHWVDGEIVEENLMCDQVGLMKQIGLG